MFIKKHLFIILNCLIFSNFPFATLAQENKPKITKIKLTAPPFFEQHRNTVYRSGGSLLGVMTGNLTKKPTGPLLTVSGLSNKDETICVKIERSSSSYIANFIVQNPKSSSVIEFILPTDEIHKMNLSSGELAIAAQVSTKQSCDHSDPYVTAKWGRVSQDTKISVLINSQRATYVGIGIEFGAPNKCFSLGEVIDNPNISTASYDKVCYVQLTGTCASEVKAIIQLHDGSHRREPIPLIIRIPCPYALYN